MPICLMTVQLPPNPLSVSQLTFPLFETDCRSRPSSVPAAVIQALIPALTQIGMATVRMRRPPFALQVGQDPSSHSLPDGLHIEFGQLISP
jgi:hypothetical protein